MQTLEFHAKEEGGGVEEREAEKCGFGAGTICGRVKKNKSGSHIPPPSGGCGFLPRLLRRHHN